MRSFENNFFLLLLFAIVLTEALRCWKCENARSDEECRLKGELVNCRSKHSCSSEYRFTGFNKLITRRCKQSHACSNNQNQNTRPAWMSTQCNDFQGSVCRCCCFTDKCNEEERNSCSQLKKCKIPILMNGAVSCNCKGVCKYYCNPGYALKGNKKTKCKIKGSSEHYSGQIPVCITTCPQQTKLQRVKVNCSNGNQRGSLCRFTCHRETFTFEPGSNNENVCLPNGNWSSPSPCCRLPCPPDSFMDLMIVLNSSKSAGLTNWKKTLNFISTLISQQPLSRKKSRVLVMSNSVGSYIFQNHENKAEINRILINLLADNDVYTNKDFKNILKKIRRRSDNRKNVTDVVLFITYDNTDDDFLIISRDTKKDKIEIYKIGIGKVLRNKNRNNSDNFSSETYKLMNQIGLDVCEDSCK